MGLPVKGNKPDANSPVTSPGKSYAPVDDQVPGGAPGATAPAPKGKVRCRSCGMATPADAARCERCNSPIRSGKQWNGQGG